MILAVISAVVKQKFAQKALRALTSATLIRYFHFSIVYGLAGVGAVNKIYAVVAQG